MKYHNRNPDPRGYLALLLGSSLLIALACSDESVMVPELEPGIGPPVLWQADDAAAWSPDGRSIAYHRNVSSSAGPPGLYLVGCDGTDNRLLAEGNFFWPQDIRFSPDGSRISMTIGREVHVLTLIDGGMEQVTHTGGNAQWADWSPDSRFIVFGSPFERDPPTPSNLFILNLSTGEECAVTSPIGRFVGGYPRWSPRGDKIAFSGPGCDAGLRDVFTINPDGTGLRCVSSIGSPGGMAEWPRWVNGGSAVVYHMTAWTPERETSSRMLDLELGNEQELPFVVGFFDAISFDSRHVVTVAAQEDSVGTLFVRDFDDASGSTLRQLTHYEPPHLESGDYRGRPGAKTRRLHHATSR